MLLRALHSSYIHLQGCFEHSRKESPLPLASNRVNDTYGKFALYRTNNLHCQFLAGLETSRYRTGMGAGVAFLLLEIAVVMMQMMTDGTPKNTSSLLLTSILTKLYKKRSVYLHLFSG